MMRVFPTLLFVLAACLPGVALAAPQILGLVATDDAVPMQCEDERCTALLSAFCLQEKRLPPDFETVYSPAAPDSVVLVVRRADGSVERMEASELVTFRSRYGYTALRADLALGRLGAMAPISVAIEVAPRSTMLPAVRPGDPDPLTAEETALAAGPLRIAAESVIEGNSDEARVTRLTARLVNALPVSGDIPAEDRADLWNRVAGAMAPEGARQAYAACGRSVDQAVGYRLRQCLEERHEKMQVRNTRAYWRSLGGS